MGRRIDSAAPAPSAGTAGSSRLCRRGLSPLPPGALASAAGWGVSLRQTSLRFVTIRLDLITRESGCPLSVMGCCELDSVNPLDHERRFDRLQERRVSGRWTRAGLPRERDANELRSVHELNHVKLHPLPRRLKKSIQKKATG